MKFGYVRVSSRTQNKARQVEALSEYVLNREKIIIDRASGKNFARPEYQTLKRCLREEAKLYVQSLDRFGRNKDQIKAELQELKTNNGNSQRNWLNDGNDEQHLDRSYGSNDRT